MIKQQNTNLSNKLDFSLSPEEREGIAINDAIKASRANTIAAAAETVAVEGYKAYDKKKDELITENVTEQLKVFDTTVGTAITDAQAAREKAVSLVGEKGISQIEALEAKAAQDPKGQTRFLQMKRDQLKAALISQDPSRADAVIRGFQLSEYGSGQSFALAVAGLDSTNTFEQKQAEQAMIRVRTDAEEMGIPQSMWDMNPQAAEMLYHERSEAYFKRTTATAQVKNQTAEQNAREPALNRYLSDAASANVTDLQVAVTDSYAEAGARLRLTQPVTADNAFSVVPTEQREEFQNIVRARVTEQLQRIEAGILKSFPNTSAERLESSMELYRLQGQAAIDAAGSAGAAQQYKDAETASQYHAKNGFGGGIEGYWKTKYAADLFRELGGVKALEGRDTLNDMLNGTLSFYTAPPGSEGGSGGEGGSVEPSASEKANVRKAILSKYQQDLNNPELDPSSMEAVVSTQTFLSMIGENNELSARGTYQSEREDNQIRNTIADPSFNKRIAALQPQAQVTAKKEVNSFIESETRWVMGPGFRETFSDIKGSGQFYYDSEKPTFIGASGTYIGTALLGLFREGDTKVAVAPDVAVRQLVSIGITKHGTVGYVPTPPAEVGLERYSDEQLNSIGRLTAELNRRTSSTFQSLIDAQYNAEQIGRAEGAVSKSVLTEVMMHDFNTLLHSDFAGMGDIG